MVQEVDHQAVVVDEEAERRYRARRTRRLQGRDLLRAWTGVTRVACCGLGLIPGHDGVEVRVGPDGRAKFAGVQSCASVWLCPRCSPVIRQKRAEDVSEAARRWTEAGKSLELVTLTVPHYWGQRLQVLCDVERDAWASILSGRAGMARRVSWRLAGFIRALEVTVGENGWHPHLHVLLFVDGEWSPVERAGFRAEVLALWSAAVVAGGLRAPSEVHGVDVRSAGEGAAAYVAKLQEPGNIGLEMARHDTKQGRRQSRVPFELLYEGLAGDRALWAEYEAAMRGRSAVRWSPGLRDLLGMGEALTDEEAAVDDRGGVLLGRLDRARWKVVCDTPGGRGRVLEVAELFGWAGVRAYVGRLRDLDGTGLFPRSRAG